MKEYKRLTIRNSDGTVSQPYGENIVEKVFYRLAELEDKIENGTLIELPCKVGDMLYKVVKNFIVEYRVHKIEFYITEDKQFGYCLYCDNYALGDFDYFYKKSIGKEVFLTKAEAEKKLKEQQNER